LSEVESTILLRGRVA